MRPRIEIPDFFAVQVEMTLLSVLLALELSTVLSGKYDVRVRWVQERWLESVGGCCYQE